MASKSLQRKRNSFKGSQRTDITAMLKSMGRGSWDGVMNVYQELVSNPPKFLLQESDNIDHRCTKSIRMSDCNKTISTAAWGVQKLTKYQLITYTDRHVLPIPAPRMSSLFAADCTNNFVANQQILYLGEKTPGNCLSPNYDEHRVQHSETHIKQMHKIRYCSTWQQKRTTVNVSWYWPMNQERMIDALVMRMPNQSLGHRSIDVDALSLGTSETKGKSGGYTCTSI